VQNFCGEFRYNLVADESQHNSWRTACSRTSIHHNVFTHYGGHGSGDSGIVWLYQGEASVSFENNTVHGGGVYTEPVIRLDGGSSVASFQRNIVAAFTGTGPLLASSTRKTVAVANANDWFVGGAQIYQIGVVTSLGNDTTADPQFAFTPDTVYRIDEGAVWLRQVTTFGVLGYYRSMFTPTNPAVAGLGRVQCHDLDVENRTTIRARCRSQSVFGNSTTWREMKTNRHVRCRGVPWNSGLRSYAPIKVRRPMTTNRSGGLSYARTGINLVSEAETVVWSDWKLPG
jgi:hypothetical protein